MGSKEEKAEHDIEKLEGLLNKTRLGISVAGVLSLGFSLILMFVLFDQTDGLFVWRFWGCMVTGLLAGIFIGLFTEYVTSYSYNPTKSIAEMSGTGPATVIIQGLGVGMISCTIPTIIIVVAILVANALASVYGISIAAVGMLSTLGVTLATDAYGPVADNAGGIAEMCESVEEHVRERTDALDALGNTTAATGKGFAIGSAVLTSVGLITAFMEESGLVCSSAECIAIDLKQPAVLCGVLIGAMLPYLFAALTMLSVGSSAESIILQVRDQFYDAECQFKKSDPNWWEKFHPEQWAEKTGEEAYEWYRPCIAIATESALREMIVPGVISIFAPVCVGFLLGSAALAGLLGGALTSGFMLAVMMANSGGAWDNAKKYTELGMLGEGREKGSESHDAVVVGDTVGDPFKDTSGPSLNILIKLMSILSLVLAPIYFVLYRKETRPFLGSDSQADDFKDSWIGPVVGVIILVVVGIGCIIFTVSNRKKKEEDTRKLEEKANARKGPQYDDVVVEPEIRSFGEEARSDPPFIVVTDFTVKTVEGGLEYAKAFDEMSSTRMPYAATYLLVQSKENPLRYTSTFVFRSSNAFVRHFQDEGMSNKLKPLMQKHVDFSQGTTKVKALGSVSASVRRVLGDMGCHHQVVAGGYSWRSGEEGDDPILVVNNFKVKGEAEGKVYSETFDEIAARMSPYAATFLLTKDPEDDVSFTEYFIFRSSQHFVDHYQTDILQSNLKTSLTECVDVDNAKVEVLAVGSKSDSENARAVLDQIKASYHEKAGGYVFGPANVMT